MVSILSSTGENVRFSMLRLSGPPPKSMASTVPPCKPITMTVDVTLQKLPKQGLGFGLGHKNGQSIVSHVQPGTVSDGKLKGNDRLIAVNGQTLEHLSHREVIGMIQSSPAEIKLRVVRQVEQDAVSSNSSQSNLATPSGNVAVEQPSPTTTNSPSADSAAMTDTAVQPAQRSAAAELAAKKRAAAKAKRASLTASKSPTTGESSRAAVDSTTPTLETTAEASSRLETAQLSIPDSPPPPPPVDGPDSDVEFSSGGGR